LETKDFKSRKLRYRVRAALPPLRGRPLPTPKMLPGLWYTPLPPQNAKEMRVQGSGVWADAANEVKITQTPNSTPSKNDFDSPRGWAPINKAAVPNTYTKQGGSKRD